MNDYSELLKVTCVPDFYVKAAEIREQLKSGKLVSSSDFIQVSIHSSSSCLFLIIIIIIIIYHR